MYHPISLKERTNRTNTDLYIYNLSARPHSELILSHWHREVEIIYCKCSGTVYLDNSSIDFKENDIIFVNKNQLHSVKTQSKGYLLCYLFDYQYLDFKLDDWCNKNIIFPLDKSIMLFPQMIDNAHKSHKNLEDILTHIFQLYNGNVQGRQILIKALLYELLFEMYSTHTFTAKKILAEKSHLEYVRTIISYMSEHISENITLEDFSQKTFLSKGYIISIFKSVTGQSPIIYLRNLRLEYASNLLKNGKSVTEAANLSGISNISYFIREYKKKYGITPKKHYL